MQRRSLLATPLIALAAPAVAQNAASSPWPSRPVRIIVGFPPGGSLDVMSRLFAELMQARTGQTFIVENRTGASGHIGSEAVAKAAPDGATIGTMGMPGILISPLLYRHIPYDPWKDFSFVSQVWEFPNVAVVPTQQVPAKTLVEFIAWAKQRPEGISFGSSGVGTTIQLSGAYLLARAGISPAVHVPYRGAAQTIPAMLSGDVQLAVDNLASYMPVIQEGRMRALAVTSGERWPTLPDVPTMAEAGMDNFIVTSWHMWVTPAATPRPIVEALGAHIRAISQDAEAQRRALGMGARLLASSPEETLARLRKEQPMWAEMIQISGAKAE
jgi:tripartite-type tricarboxylate transporter receptor subunit TctC